MTRDWLNLRPPPLIFLGSSLMSLCQKYRERKGLQRAFLVDFKFPCGKPPFLANVELPRQIQSTFATIEFPPSVRPSSLISVGRLALVVLVRLVVRRR